MLPDLTEGAAHHTPRTRRLRRTSLSLSLRLSCYSRTAGGEVGVELVCTLKVQAILRVQSAQYRTRSSEIAFLRTLLVCLSICIPYQLKIVSDYAITQYRTNASEIVHLARIVCSALTLGDDQTVATAAVLNHHGRCHVICGRYQNVIDKCSRAGLHCLAGSCRHTICFRFKSSNSCM